MLPVHYRAQRGCSHILKTPNYLLWRWCSALMPPSSLSVRTPIWGPSRKNAQHLPNSPMPPVFWAGGRSPFSCECSGGKSWCRTIGHHPSSLPTPLPLHQALWLGWIAPNSSISYRWFQASSTNGRGIHPNHSLKGVSSITFIMCSVEWVQPNSAGSNENMLWYLARSWQAASASLGGQESNPLKSNSSNSLPCLCLTVNLGVWGP